MEVQEAIEALNGKGPKDLMDVVYALGYLMLKAAGVAEDENEARTMMEKVIASGKALDKFADFVEAQGGRKEQVYHPQLLAKAAITETITAPEDGYVEALNAMAIGTACMSLGGGRETKESQIDLTAGIRLKKKIGDSVKKGECLAELYGNDAAKSNEEKELVQNCLLYTSALLIDGKRISAEIKDELKEEVVQLKEQGITGALAVIQVGNDPASSVYVLSLIHI